MFVVVQHHVGEEGKQLTWSYVCNYSRSEGSNVPLPFVYVDTNGSITHESFDSENEFTTNRDFWDDSGWIILWQGLDKPIIYEKNKC